MTLTSPRVPYGNSSLSLSRRQVLSQIGGGFGTLGLASFLDSQSVQAARTHFRARATRVIYLFMNGGPSQIDTFDPKPMVAKFAGQRPEGALLRTERKTFGLLPAPWKFPRRGESGLPVTDLLPRIGDVIDDICVIRSMHGDNPTHAPSLHLMNSGTIQPTWPSMGSWISYGLGTENQDLPGFVVLCPGKPVVGSKLWSNAFLPGKHQGTYIDPRNLDPNKMIRFLRNFSIDRTDQRRQLDLVQGLNESHLSVRGHDPLLEARIAAMETAFRMQFEASEVFDVRDEPSNVREAYGTSDFANGCLLARRLVERGVRMVQIYYGDVQPWDTHIGNNRKMRTMCGDIDRPIGALLKDLKARGLLDETLVVWGGEFGRTPVSEAGNGRDHNHWGFSMWLAGGGVRGGMAYGATDDFGFRAMENKVHVHDLHATILHLLGLDHERMTYHYSGRDFRLTDVHGRVVKEIIA